MIDYQRPFDETLKALAERSRQLRLLRKLSQVELATRAGVGVATIRRFEKNAGTALLENVLRIAAALQADAAFDTLFAPPAYASLDEALERPALTARKRAPRQP